MWELCCTLVKNGLHVTDEHNQDVQKLSNKNVRTLDTCLEIQTWAGVGRDQSGEAGHMAALGRDRGFCNYNSTISPIQNKKQMEETQVLLNMITISYFYQMLIEQKGVILF